MDYFAYPLGDSVEVEGVEYELDCSFDVVLRFLDLLQDKSVNQITKIDLSILLILAFPEDAPESMELKVELIRRAVDFYFKGKEEAVVYDLEGNPMPSSYTRTGGSGVKMFDYKQDSDYIFSSFLMDYGIDLYEEQGRLNWFKFRSLLNGLSENTKFMRVVEIRGMELPSGKGSAKQRAQIMKLKDEYRLKN